MAAWALLLTGPNQEFLVSKRLQRHGIEHLLIKRRIAKIFRGRRLELFRAAFPRYLFVVANDAWEMIREIVGVVGFVCIGQRPALLSEKTIDQLRSRLDSNGVLPVVDASKFRFGQRVVIRGDGVMAGHEAIFQYTLSHGRCCVLQEWMNQFVPVEVAEGELMAIGEYKALRRKVRRSRSRAYRKRMQTNGRRQAFQRGDLEGSALAG